MAIRKEGLKFLIKCSAESRWGLDLPCCVHLTQKDGEFVPYCNKWEKHIRPLVVTHWKPIDKEGTGCRVWRKDHNESQPRINDARWR